MRFSGGRPLSELRLVPDEYETWLRELRRYVHRLTGDSDQAEDIAQEAILRLMRAQPATIDQPRAWLFRAATNLVRDQVRHEAVVQRTPPMVTQPMATPDQELERAEKIRGVRAALDRIPPRDRELLILRESGFKHAEIADVIGVSPASISVLAARALEKFRAAYTLAVKA